MTPFEFTGSISYGTQAEPRQAMLAGGGELTLTLQWDPTAIEPTWLISAAAFQFYPLQSAR